MCTVTFFPQPCGGFVLSSNRDECPDRKISGVAHRQSSSARVVFPQDALAGGTWIAADSNGQVLCLLNGALSGHMRTPPYRKSRGLIVLELLESTDILSRFKEYDLEGIEPFTLIWAGQGILWEFCWDGERRGMQRRDTRSKHIWSSPTLYDHEARMRRERWLDDWFDVPGAYTREAILRFHQEAGKEDVHDGLVIYRAGTVQTVSISQFVMERGAYSFYYFELEERIPVLHSQISL